LRINSEKKAVNRPINSINRSRSTQSKVNKTKLKNISTEKGEISDREREIFLNFFLKKGIKSAKAEVERFINHYQSTGWVNKNGVAIHDKLKQMLFFNYPKNCGIS